MVAPPLLTRKREEKGKRQRSKTIAQTRNKQKNTTKGRAYTKDRIDIRQEEEEEIVSDHIIFDRGFDRVLFCLYNIKLTGVKLVRLLIELRMS